MRQGLCAPSARSARSGPDGTATETREECMFFQTGLRLLRQSYLPRHNTSANGWNRYGSLNASIGKTLPGTACLHS